MSKTSSPIRLTLPSMRVMLVVAALLVVTVGIPLNLLPLQTDRFFAWTIATPLTAAFLGAAYWSSGVLEFLASRERVWARARIAVPAVFLFTILTLIVTLIHRDRFHFDSPDFITRSGTWVWLLVYAVVPIILGVLGFVQSRAPGIDPPRAVPMRAWLRVAAILQAVIMIPVGIALLLAPEAMATVWPWSLTPLTGRAIGAWVVSIGVAAAHAAWENDVERVRVATISYIVIGVLELIALLRFAGDFQWGSVSGWVYLIFLVSFIMVGFGGWRAARSILNESNSNQK